MRETSCSDVTSTPLCTSRVASAAGPHWYSSFGARAEHKRRDCHQHEDLDAHGHARRYRRNALRAAAGSVSMLVASVWSSPPDIAAIRSFTISGPTPQSAS
jgi:hypothetical protein